MSPDERRRRLLHGLNASSGEVVFINIAHLIEATNLDIAESMVESLTEFNELVSIRGIRRPRLISSGMAQIDRVKTIEVISRFQAGMNKAKIDKASGQLSLDLES